ncbi:MAG: SAM-dependent methyltransferase, partial [Kiritimatiellia bacterium]
YACPFCNGHFSAFLPTGSHLPVLKEKQVVSGGYRTNAICPRCRSTDRERLVYLYLQKYQPTLFTQPFSLLHIAPERNLSRTLKKLPQIDYTSADLDASLADIRMDITNIERDDATYDGIICNHVLEHIPDDALAMRELYRVLKPGGFAILQVPISYTIGSTYEDFSITSPEAREAAFGQNDHVRIYGSDYASRLEEAGFTVTLHDYLEDVGDEAFTRHALLKEEKLFVCAKATS